MITLRDLLDATWDVTLLRVDLRKPDGELIQRYILGEGQCEDIATAEQKSDMNAGKLEMIDAKINHYGDIYKNGNWESGWGTNFKAIPKSLLDAEVVHFHQKSRYGTNTGSELSAWLRNQQLTIADITEGATPK